MSPLASPQKPNLLPFSPWPCGSLQTGATSVGVSNLVSLLLLFLWSVQVLAEAKHAFIGIIVASVVSFVLVVLNVCLVAGAANRQRSLVAPWLASYILIFLGIIVGCSVEFAQLGKLKPIAVAVVALLAYFYLVVLAFLHELLFEERAKEAEDKVKDKDRKKSEANNATDACLITLNENAGANETSFAGARLLLEPAGENDTFTELANRSASSSVVTGNRTTNPFLSSQDDAESNNVTNNSNPTFTATFLPQPDEVIQIPEEQSPLLKTAAEDDSVDAKVTLSTTQNTTYARRNVAPSVASQSGLADIDTTFTPFKKKSVSRLGDDEDCGEELEEPKMKIFLPKSGADDSDSDGSDSSDGSGDGVVFDSGDAQAVAGSKVKEFQEV